MPDFQELDIENEINREFSKERVTKIASYIGADTERFAILMNIFLRGQYVNTQKAGWILSECAENYPLLIIPYFRNLIQKLQEPFATDSVKRNIVRVWQFVNIPDEYIDDIYDICFGFINSHEAIAIRVFSMTVCYNIARKIPELRHELRLTIEDVLLKNQDGSAAIISRGNKILKDLKKK
ncbi:hypothetical protein [Emticicia agri]|uniref:DNA alkylation repair protein n=1 Tax=Emticicia agri TaxID=2492393 RepID=A0A4Q5M4J1_9BACT|nr:hypothetical protein [Emticicia agri]RYU96787.1 hypothetical protein EWM59_04475 [Emticicia agri]